MGSPDKDGTQILSSFSPDPLAAQRLKQWIPPLEMKGIPGGKASGRGMREGEVGVTHTRGRTPKKPGMLQTNALQSHFD